LVGRGRYGDAPAGKNTPDFGKVRRRRTQALASALLNVEGLAKHFGGVIALADFAIEIRHGELVGLIGQNGAGKTTVFNLLYSGMNPAKLQNIKTKMNCLAANCEEPHWGSSSSYQKKLR
jgi:ABC-type branched-subunit amino acid transport system ATPase component